MSDRPTEPAVVGVVGAGTMGAGIAQLALEAGGRVILHDADPAAVERARERIADGIARRRRRLASATTPDGAAEPGDALDRLSVAPDVESLARQAVISIEAVIEDLELKRRVFAALDSAAAPGAILASNTSALSIAAIASATTRPERVVGLHFFNPAAVMPLVEVVAAPGTDRGVVEAASRLVTGWGKVAVRSADAPGFIVNRVNRPFTLEALQMLEAGDGSVESIDRAIRAAGFPMGPFELMDLIGIDVNLAAARGIYEAFHYEPRFRPSVIQERLVEAGRFGRKTSEGFYWYGEDGRPLGAAGAFAAEPGPSAATIPAAQRLPSGVGPSGVGPAAEIAVPDDGALGPAAIADRIELAIVNEAWRALGDGVAGRDDIDLAVRLGAAHPIGPFERTAALGGPAAVLERIERWRAAGPRFDPALALSDAAARR